MKIASWNVNSVKARRERLLAWLDKHKPDILCLQELKTLDEGFPSDDIYELGYRSIVHAQKTYNGVAILSNREINDPRIGIDDGDEDAEARLISANISGIRVICCYVPNGQEVASPKWPYKLRWLDRLEAYLQRHHAPSEPLIVCGDFNIAPEDRDCYDPEGWKDTVLCHAEVRARFQRLCAWGLVDTYRLKESASGKYSWWDYRMLAFPKGRGLRIDLILGTAPIAERVTAVAIDRDERKGKLPSDHAPVMVELSE